MEKGWKGKTIPFCGFSFVPEPDEVHNKYQVQTNSKAHCTLQFITVKEKLNLLSMHPPYGNWHKHLFMCKLFKWLSTSMHILTAASVSLRTAKIVQLLIYTSVYILMSPVSDSFLMQKHNPMEYQSKLLTLSSSPHKHLRAKGKALQHISDSSKGRISGGK